MHPIKKWYTAFRYLKKGYQPVFLDFPVDMKPRWEATGGNEHIAKIIAAKRQTFRENLEDIANTDPIATVVSKAKDLDWRNGFMPALDAFTLMHAALTANKIYMEVGSGFSTQFVRAALSHSNKNTKIVSIDPHPRKEIDALCDEVIRGKLEELDLTIFEKLDNGDVLFIDNSHRSFMNSDVTVSMLDVLPRLKPGVLVGFHDIMLPFDYPQNWSKRAYNEQYLLACYLLANPNYFHIQFANRWIVDQKLHETPLAQFWETLGNDVRDRHASAFWGVKAA